MNWVNPSSRARFPFPLPFDNGLHISDPVPKAREAPSDDSVRVQNHSAYMQKNLVKNFV
jgi:hypothetical protein